MKRTRQLGLLTAGPVQQMGVLIKPVHFNGRRRRGASCGICSAGGDSAQLLATYAVCPRAESQLWHHREVRVFFFFFGGADGDRTRFG